MKKIISLLLAVCLIFALVGCNEETPAVDNPSEGEPSSSSEPTQTKSYASVKNENGIHMINDTDGVTKFAIFSDTHIGNSKRPTRSLQRAIEWANAREDLDFVYFLGDNINTGYSMTDSVTIEQLAEFNETMTAIKKPYIALKGNHDANVTQFEDNTIVMCGDVALIGFNVDYYILDPNNSLDCTGYTKPVTLTWLEQALEKCKGKRVILSCHFAIADAEKGMFKYPILPAGPVPKKGIAYVDFGREKILELADKYNVELYFNGHEHNKNLPMGEVGSLTNYQIGALGNEEVATLITVTEDKAVIEVYSVKSGEIERSAEYTFTRNIIK